MFIVFIKDKRLFRLKNGLKITLTCFM